MIVPFGMAITFPRMAMIIPVIARVAIAIPLVVIIMPVIIGMRIVIPVIVIIGGVASFIEIVTVDVPPSTVIRASTTRQE